MAPTSRRSSPIRAGRSWPPSPSPASHSAFTSGPAWDVPMSEATVDTLSWIAFAGLILVTLGLGALVDTERKRAVLMLRLRRAGGEALGPRAATPGTGRSGSFAWLRAGLRRIVLRIGERLSVILGGEARDTA